VGLGETGDWAGAVERIIKMIENGPDADPLEGALPEGYGSQRLLEAFGRQLEEEHGMELGMALPTLLSAFSAAMQGAFQAPMVRTVKPSPQYLWVPTVVQFIGIAEAGQQKSTLLGEINEPLKRALDVDGADHRRELVATWRAAAVKDSEADGVAITTNQADWEKVYQGGLCPTSITSQGTPEGIRNNLAAYGGHRAIVTAEPDVLREVGAYTSNKSAGGSLVNFLSGWDQDDMATDRAGAAGGGHFVREPSLPCVIMLQPASFRQFTGGRGDGNDDFVTRGVFSRMLLWEAQRAPIVTDFPDLDDWELDPGWDPSAPLGSMKAVLAEKLEGAMLAVVKRSNPYRVSKGLEAAYREAKLTWEMPRPKRVGRTRLGLDGTAGHKAAIRVQKMRAMISEAVRAADVEHPGYGAVLDPFAQRFTSHVMRLATVATLAADPGALTVDTGQIEDMATRVMPWLWAGWWRVMRERMYESNKAVLSQGLLKNTGGKDLSGRALLLWALEKMDQGDGPAAMAGFLPSAILKRAEAKIPHEQRTPGLRQELKQTLAEMAPEGLIEVVGAASDAAGKQTARYRITEAGRVEVKSYAG
jgi:hypothetical protein